MTRYTNFTCLLLSAFFILVTASACKKRKAFKEENAQLGVDVRMFQGQMDEAISEINQAIMGQPLMRGKSSEINESLVESICGLDQDTSMVYKGIIRLVYNGETCKGVKRTGVVLVSILDYPIKKWKNAGASIKIDFISYKAGWTSDGRTVQIDGTVFLKNESGKTWYDLQFLNVTNLVQIHTGDNLKATFGSETVDFNVNRRLEFTYNSATKATTCKVVGMGSSDGQSGLESWGFNREGLKFTSKVTSSVMWKTTCGALAPIDGEVIIDEEEKKHNLNCNFSVDQNGNNVSTDTPCPYGMQVSWSFKSKMNSRIFSY